MIRVAAFNAECRLTRCAEPKKLGSPEHIVASVGRLAADLVVMPEASEGTDIEPHIEAALHDEYQVLSVAYESSGDRRWSATNNPTMRILTRLNILESEVIRPGDVRNMLSVVVLPDSASQPIRVVAVHLDDRTEENRLKQVQDLIDSYLSQPDMPTVMLGDFNALQRSSLHARMLGSRTLSMIYPRLPLISGQIRDMLDRAVGMSDGRTMDCLLSAGLVSSDPDMESTMTLKMRGREYLPSFRFGKIDYIMHTKDLVSTDHIVHDYSGSDHRPISSSIWYA